jgi:hypothetical protein
MRRAKRRAVLLRSDRNTSVQSPSVPVSSAPERMRSATPCGVRVVQATDLEHAPPRPHAAEPVHAEDPVPLGSERTRPEVMPSATPWGYKPLCCIRCEPLQLCAATLVCCQSEGGVSGSHCSNRCSRHILILYLERIIRQLPIRNFEPLQEKILQPKHPRVLSRQYLRLSPLPCPPTCGQTRLRSN